MALTSAAPPARFAFGFWMMLQRLDRLSDHSALAAP
jgi:hypothetical protein